jgi:hypothetical protein
MDTKEKKNDTKFYDGNGGSNWAEWSRFIIIGVRSNTETIDKMKEKLAEQDSQIKVLKMQMAAILFIAGLLATGASDYIFEFIKKGIGI